jgi:hypothetical protein
MSWVKLLPILYVHALCLKLVDDGLTRLWVSAFHFLVMHLSDLIIFDMQICVG